MVRQRAIETGLMLALGATALWDGLRVLLLPSTQVSRPFYAGGYEMLIGGILVAMALVYWVREGHRPGIDWRHARGLARVLQAFAVLMAYTFAIPFMGYMLSTALVVIVLLRLFSPYGWVPTIAASCLGAAGTAYFWIDVMVISLPKGFIPWP